MDIKLNGKEYVVRYPLNSVRALERALGKSFLQIGAEMESGNASLDTMLALIWAGVLYANRALTLELVSMGLEDCPDLLTLAYGCYREFQESVLPRLTPKVADGEDAEPAEKN